MKSRTTFRYFSGSSKKGTCELFSKITISDLGSALWHKAGSKVKVKIPSGTQTGRRFRLSAKGMPVLRSKQTGDMYVQVVVETPQNLTKRQRELLAEFDKLSSDNTQPESAGFFSRVKEFLDGLGSRGGHSEPPS